MPTSLEPWMFKEFKIIYPNNRRIHSKLAFYRFKEWLAKTYPDLPLGVAFNITFEDYIKGIDK